MKIKASINFLPDKRDCVSLFSQTEGDFSIYIDNNLFFKEESICLLELCWECLLWRSGYKKFLHYVSMDSEESVFEIDVVEDEYKIDSVWKLWCNPCHCHSKIVHDAIDSFIRALSVEFTCKTNIRLRHVYVKIFREHIFFDTAIEFFDTYFSH
jgi:hypothetical protein